MGDVIAEIQFSIALIMNPSKHGMINSSPSLFDDVDDLIEHFIISHLAFPLCQVGIHVIPGHEIILIIDAVLF